MYLKQWCLFGLVLVTVWYFPVKCDQSSYSDESYSTEAGAEECSLPGEIYQACGTACPKTCSNYNKTGTACITLCVPGCFCEPELVRDSTGNCIDQASCPPSCQENEEYTECGSTCETTCDNYNQTNRICQAMCRPGCTCQQGFVRDHSSGSCIKKENCPIADCPANSMYSSCGTKCEKTCGNVGININCIQECAQGCFCDIGYVKTKNGQCVTPQNCPADEVCTGPNEHFSECPSPCPITCANYLNPPKICPDYCLAGCDCNSGYYRNANNICVKLEDCQGICPGKNEIYECGSACDTTCDNYDKPCPIINIKCTDLCRCASGHARNNKNECIPIGKCPPKPPKRACRNKF